MAMPDIVPDLLEQFQSTKKDLTEKSEILSYCLDTLGSGEASFRVAQDYAGELGKITYESLLETVSIESLPNGKMYYNIADRLITPALTDNYNAVSDFCVQTQEALNEAAGIGIKAQTAPINDDRIDGIINRICASDNFDDVKWLLKSPVENFTRSVVDDHVKANADFHYKSGLSPKIIRTTDGKCCKWCSARAGVYDYKPDMDREVFRRHENCGCTVEYDPADGSKKRQNAHTKAWRDAPAVKETVTAGIELDDWGGHMSDKKVKAQVKKYLEFFNHLDLSDADPNVVKVYQNLGELLKRVDQQGIPYQVKFGKGCALSRSYNPVTHDVTRASTTVPKPGKKVTRGQMGTFIHEFAHTADWLGCSDPSKTSMVSKSFTDLNKAFKNPRPMGNEVRDYITKMKKQQSEIIDRIYKEYDQKRDALDIDKLGFKEWDKQWKKLTREKNDAIDDAIRSLGGFTELCDIYDALNDGVLYDKHGLSGHGGKYYRQPGNKECEVLAQYASLTCLNPEIVEMIRRDQPGLIEACEGVFAQIAGAI